MLSEKHSLSLSLSSHMKNIFIFLVFYSAIISLPQLAFPLELHCIHDAVSDKSIDYISDVYIDRQHSVQFLPVVSCQRVTSGAHQSHDLLKLIVQLLQILTNFFSPICFRKKRNEFVEQAIDIYHTSFIARFFPAAIFLNTFSTSAVHHI